MKKKSSWTHLHRCLFNIEHDYWNIIIHHSSIISFPTGICTHLSKQNWYCHGNPTDSQSSMHDKSRCWCSFFSLLFVVAWKTCRVSILNRKTSISLHSLDTTNQVMDAVWNTCSLTRLGLPMPESVIRMPSWFSTSFWLFTRKTKQSERWRKMYFRFFYERIKEEGRKKQANDETRPKGNER